MLGLVKVENIGYLEEFGKPLPLLVFSAQNTLHRGFLVLILCGEPLVCKDDHLSAMQVLKVAF